METGWPDALCGIGRGFDGVGPPGAGGAGGVCPVGGGWRLAEAAVPVRGGGKRAGLGTGAPGILPAPPAAVLPRGRGRWHGEDLLLPGCALLFLVLAFCLVNPTWQPSPIFPEVWMLAAFGIWEMGLVSWLVLRLLRGLEEGTIEKVSAVLRVLLVGCAALLVFAAALHGSRAVAAAVDGPAPEQIAMGQLITGGPFDRVMSAGSLWLTAVLALAELVPNLLAAWVLLLAADLTDALALGPFSGESAARCAATARRCRLAIQLTLALALGGNLVKLALVGVIPQVQFSLDLPLLPLPLAAALYLLCRCIQRGKELQEDNDSII